MLQIDLNVQPPPQVGLHLVCLVCGGAPLGGLFSCLEFTERVSCGAQGFAFVGVYFVFLGVLFRKISCPQFCCLQFLGRKWLRQFYGRLAFFGYPMPIKFRVLGEGVRVFWKGVAVPILFLWARGFFLTCEGGANLGGFLLGSGTKKRGFLEGGFCKNVHLSWRWRSDCQMYCWAQCPWVLFIPWPRHWTLQKPPLQKRPFLGS